MSNQSINAAFTDEPPPLPNFVGPHPIFPKVVEEIDEIDLNHEIDQWVLWMKRDFASEPLRRALRTAQNLVFMRLQSARDRRDKKAIEILTEIKEALG